MSEYQSVSYIQSSRLLEYQTFSDVSSLLADQMSEYQSVSYIQSSSLLEYQTFSVFQLFSD